MEGVLIDKIDYNANCRRVINYGSYEKKITLLHEKIIYLFSVFRLLCRKPLEITMDETRLLEPCNVHPESILGKQVSILFVERKNTPLSFIFVSVGQIPVIDFWRSYFGKSSKKNWEIYCIALVGSELLDLLTLFIYYDTNKNNIDNKATTTTTVVFFIFVFVSLFSLASSHIGFL